MRLPARLLPWLVCLPAVLAAGCARIDRSLVLDSDPAGARLYVDGGYVGLTPQRIPYVHPGRVVVRIEKEGYESVAAEVEICTTSDARIGSDFFAENLTPGGLHTVASHRFPLKPLTPVSYTDDQLKELLRRASEFRRTAEGGPVGTGSGPATAPAPAAAPPPAAATPPTPAPAAGPTLPPPVHRAGSPPPAPPASAPPPPPQGPPLPSR